MFKQMNRAWSGSRTFLLIFYRKRNGSLIKIDEYDDGFIVWERTTSILTRDSKNAVNGLDASTRINGESLKNDEYVIREC